MCPWQFPNACLHYSGALHGSSRTWFCRMPGYIYIPGFQFGFVYPHESLMAKNKKKTGANASLSAF